jgi:YVTN family beta-propeller protein
LAVVGFATPEAAASTPSYVASTINSLGNPSVVAISPDGSTVYVVDGTAVTEVNPSTDTVTGSITDPSFSHPVALAVAPSGQYLYVLNEDGVVSVVDTTTHTVTATIGSNQPSEGASDIVVSPTGTTAYVSQSGIIGVGVVWVLDLTDDSVTGSIQVTSAGEDAQAGELALSPDGTSLYVVSGGNAEARGTVKAIDTSTDQVVGVVNGSDNATGVAVGNDGSTLYVVQYGASGGQVAVIDLATSTVVDTITGLHISNGGSPDFSPDGSRLYVTSFSSVSTTDLSIIDTQSGTIAATLPISGAYGSLVFAPDGTAAYVVGSTPGWDNGNATLLTVDTATDAIDGAVTTFGYDSATVAASPDSGTVYVASQGSPIAGQYGMGGGLTVINATTSTTEATIAVGTGPDDLVVSPDGRTLYVSNFGAGSDTTPLTLPTVPGTVSVVDTATNSVRHTITVGLAPDAIAVSPDGRAIYVSNFQGDSVSVINTATETVTQTIPVDDEPTGIAVSPDGETLYATTYDGVHEVLSLVNLSAGSVTATVPLSGDYSAWYAGSSNIAVSPDGHHVYVGTETGFGGGLYVIDTSTDTASTPVPDPSNPSAPVCARDVTISRDGNWLYADCNGQVSVVNLADDSVATTIDHDSGSTQSWGVAGMSEGPSGSVYVAGGNDLHVLTPDPALTAAPAAPLQVTAAPNTTTLASSGSATVSFAPPSADGGADVTSYTVTATDETRSDRGGQTSYGSSSPVTIGGLTHGDSYIFTVTATNVSGTGPPSQPSQPVTIPGIPGDPTITGMIPGNSRITVSFSTPPDGDSPITSYNVYATDHTSSARGGQTATGTASPLTLTGLTNGDSYVVGISACNAVGCSPPPLPSGPAVPTTLPGAPINVTGVAGNSQATVSFSPPPSDGGAAVISYTVTALDHTDASRGGETASGDSGPITVTGLTNGDSYTFAVTATNSVGTGPTSISTSAVLPELPALARCSQTLSPGTVVGMAVTGDGRGYWIASSTGRVAACGDAPVLGNGSPHTAAIAAAPIGNGYWLVTQTGQIQAFGRAVNHGELTGSDQLTKPIVAMAADPATGGYWLLGGDGGVFSFDAPFYGSTGTIHLAAPAVGLEATPDGRGYRFVASDGGIFDFGDAHFYGSTGTVKLNKPIIGMANDPATGGYWLDASDGGIFSFHAPFYGSTGNVKLAQPCVGMTALPDGTGYRFVAADGGIFDFGHASFQGSAA